MPNFKFTDNSAAVKSELERRTAAALEAMGLQAEGYAKLNVRDRPVPPNSWYTCTGRQLKMVCAFCTDMI